MSEFAKQPHPDAAHRERLSREIPGLSPRQVQVWFQNRFVFSFDMEAKEEGGLGLLSNAAYDVPLDEPRSRDSQPTTEIG